MNTFFVNSKALERKVKISNSNGMHARPATKFAEIANKYSSEIYVKTKNKEVEGKSVIDLLTLGAENGAEIVIYAKGIDAVEALDALEGLVKSKFEEEFMEIRKGIAVSPGVVIREAFLFESEGYRIPRHIIRKEDVESEIFRLEKAIEDSKKEIDDLERKVSSEK